MYADLTTFIEAYGEQLTIELTNLEDPSAATVNETVLNRGLARASALIDSYLAGRYALPLSSTPAVIETFCLDIARYYLGHNAQEEDVRLRYEDALKTLALIADGTLTLGLPLADQPPAVGSPRYLSPGAVFTRSTLEGY